VDAQGLTHGFIFDDGHFQSVDDPNGVGTTLINGINDRGQIVGFFKDAAGNTDGFFATPHREGEDGREREND
jgi:probable HAF family extracellular repeat protein